MNSLQVIWIDLLIYCRHTATAMAMHLSWRGFSVTCYLTAHYKCLRPVGAAVARVPGTLPRNCIADAIAHCPAGYTIKNNSELTVALQITKGLDDLINRVTGYGKIIFPMNCVMFFPSCTFVVRLEVNVDERLVWEAAALRRGEFELHCIQHMQHTTPQL